MNKHYKLTTYEKLSTAIKVPIYLARALAIEGINKVKKEKE